MATDHGQRLQELASLLHPYGVMSVLEGNELLVEPEWLFPLMPDQRWLSPQELQVLEQGRLHYEELGREARGGESERTAQLHREIRKIMYCFIVVLASQGLQARLWEGGRRLRSEEVLLARLSLLPTSPVLDPELRGFFLRGGSEVHLG